MLTATNGLQHIVNQQNDTFTIAHAVLAYEFFHLLNAYYGSIISSCTMESCPIMRIRTSSGLQALIWPPDFVTSTKDGHSSRSSMTTLFFSASNTLCREISATNYIDSALTWIETQLECTEKFPKAMSNAYIRMHELIFLVRRWISCWV